MDHLSPPPSPPTNSSAESKLLNYPKIMNGLDKLHVTMSPSSLIQRANLNTALKLNRGKYSSICRQFEPVAHNRQHPSIVDMNDFFFLSISAHIRFIVAVQSADLFEHIFLALTVSAAISECSRSSCCWHGRRTSITRIGKYA